MNSLSACCVIFLFDTFSGECFKNMYKLCIPICICIFNDLIKQCHGCVLLIRLGNHLQIAVLYIFNVFLHFGAAHPTKKPKDDMMMMMMSI